MKVEDSRKYCKHEIGKAYLSDGILYMVIRNDSRFQLLDLEDGDCITPAYTSLEDLDEDNKFDTPVDTKIVIMDK